MEEDCIIRKGTTKTEQPEKPTARITQYIESLLSFKTPPIFLFLVVLAWNYNKVTQSEDSCENSLEIPDTNPSCALFIAGPIKFATYNDPNLYLQKTR